MLTSPNGPAIQHSLRVLVVEDDADNCEFLTRILTRFGYQTDRAETLAEGMQMLLAFPDVVVLDLGLPDGNGIDLLRYVRGKELPIKVALLTGAVDAAADAVMLKPDVVFVKPLDAAELIGWLKSANAS